MALEILTDLKADRQEMVKRLQEQVAWLEAVHELQCIRLSRLEQRETDNTLDEETRGWGKRPSQLLNNRAVV